MERLRKDFVTNPGRHPKTCLSFSWTTHWYDLPSVLMSNLLWESGWAKDPKSACIVFLFVTWPANCRIARIRSWTHQSKGAPHRPAGPLTSVSREQKRVLNENLLFSALGRCASS